jgi:hypothetical protein
MASEPQERCARCYGTFDEHSIYHDAQPEGVPEALFSFKTSGLICTRLLHRMHTNDDTAGPVNNPPQRQSW